MGKVPLHMFIKGTRSPYKTLHDSKMAFSFQTVTGCSANTCDSNLNVCSFFLLLHIASNEKQMNHNTIPV